MNTPKLPAAPGPLHPIRRAVLRGLGVVLPPLLTVVVFIWAWTMIDTNILMPAERLAGRIIVWSIRDIKTGIPEGALREPVAEGGLVTRFSVGDQTYVRVSDTNKWIPEAIYTTATEDRPQGVTLDTANDYYHVYVQMRYLQRSKTLPIFLAVFILGLYLTGKLMAAGVGRFVWSIGEGIVHRMPIVRNVYAAVKQITDYIFNEQEVTFNRVVAVEWPRKGLWTIAFVTGEGFREIREAAGEPILSLLVPTSPMPATGFTCTVPKSETIELDITIDQAVQFIVSCGVVVPPHQQWTTSGDRLKSEIEQQMRDSGKLAKPA
jgi:uncharacterized membrane protein